MALQWVRNNIKSFGGNPDAVTIYGESAGAMSCAVRIVWVIGYEVYQCV